MMKISIVIPVFNVEKMLDALDRYETDLVI